MGRYYGNMDVKIYPTVSLLTNLLDNLKCLELWQPIKEVKLVCKYCNRILPNKKFRKGQYCLWCYNKKEKNV